MLALKNRKAAVVGCDTSAIAAASLLSKSGASVTAVCDCEAMREAPGYEELTTQGVEVVAAAKLEIDGFAVCVVGPSTAMDSEIVSRFRDEGVPAISELELGFQESSCLHIGVTGSNGKTTTCRLIAAALTGGGKKTRIGGTLTPHISTLARETAKLDLLTLEVSALELEGIQHFRPSVAVILNITPDHFDRFGTMERHVLNKARILMNQQAFDWAIIQSEALAMMQAFGVSIRSKIITFSSSNRRADLFLDRSLIVSQIPGWSGPLLDLDDCQLHGAHNAENLMAALAVGRVMRIPLERVTAALRGVPVPEFRCQRLGEIDGVQFINDGKSTNLDALRRAIHSVHPGRPGESNLWLIAGGADKAAEFFELGPLLSNRAKGVLLLGAAQEKMRVAWSLYSPCTLVANLRQAVMHAMEAAKPGDTILFSPACAPDSPDETFEVRSRIFAEVVEGLRDAKKASKDAEETHSVIAPKKQTR